LETRQAQLDEKVVRKAAEKKAITDKNLQDGTRDDRKRFAGARHMSCCHKEGERTAHAGTHPFITQYVESVMDIPRPTPACQRSKVLSG
jgi:hypothetical protein